MEKQVLPRLPMSLFRFNVAPHAASGGSMVDGYRADQMEAYGQECFEAGLAKREAIRKAVADLPLCPRCGMLQVECDAQKNANDPETP